MSKQDEKRFLGLLVAGAMLIPLGAGVVVAEDHESGIHDPVTIASESVAEPAISPKTVPADADPEPDIYAYDASA